MKIMVTPIFFLLVAVSTYGQTVPPPEQLTKAEQKILNLEHELTSAIRPRDEKSLNRIIFKDFILSGIINLNSPPLSRAQFIENTLRHLKFDSVKIDKPRVRIYGRTATVHALFKIKGNYRGQTFDETRALIDTWVKLNGHWQLVARFYVTLPTPHSN